MNESATKVARYFELTRQEESIAKEKAELFRSLVIDSHELFTKDGSILLVDTDISQRAWNCLRRKGIHTLLQLAKADWYALVQTRGFGRKSMDDVNRILQFHGFPPIVPTSTNAWNIEDLDGEEDDF